MALQESGEMYLEAVYVLSKKQPVVHSVDVAEYLGYSKPSVSRAVSLLKNGGYLTAEHGGALHLTEAGEEIGHKIFERHKVLTRCLMALGVDVTTAAEDACRLEHAISDVSFTAIKAHLEKAGLLD